MVYDSGDGYIDDYYNQGGLFAGLCSHSMILSPISAIACIVCFYRAFVLNLKKYWIFFCPCFGALVLSASRISILGTVLAVFLIIIYASKNIFSSIKILFVSILVMMFSFPLWSGIAAGVINKQAQRTSAGGVFDSRTTKFMARFDEFTNSPIIGVGFSAIDPYGRDGYNKINGTIEPGSSWLCVLSMTGIIGFVLFVSIVFKSWINVKKSKLKHRLLFMGLLSFFIVHMIAEGYIYSAGSVMCFIVWLIIGVCYHSPFYKVNVFE